MSPIRMSQIESAIRIVLAFHEARNRHDLKGLLQYIGDSCVYEHHSPSPDGTRYSGREHIEKFWEDFFCQNPRAAWTIEEIFSIRTRCILRWQLSGLDIDEGATSHIRGADIFTVEEDHITEQHSYIKR